MNKIDKLPPFKRFCVTIGNLPSSYVDSMSYYECLMWLCKYLKDTVIPAVNENAEAVNELINWFNNLDVQEEIDNKLDEMVESGELQEIIASYLDSRAIFGFDTKADMLASENLIDGSYARTLGNTNYTTGDGNLYKIREITNQDVIDNDNITAMTNSETLIAEKIPYSNGKTIQDEIDDINDDLEDIPDVVGCVLRPQANQTTPWLLFSDTNHVPKGVSSIEIESNRIKVNFDKTYGTIISFSCEADETLKYYGIDVSASVGRDSAYIYFIPITPKNINIVCSSGTLSSGSGYVNSIEWESDHIKLGLKNVPGAQWSNAFLSSSATNKITGYFNATANRYINITVCDSSGNVINAGSSATFNVNVGLYYQGYLNPNFISIWDNDLLPSTAILFSAIFNK